MVPPRRRHELASGMQKMPEAENPPFFIFRLFERSVLRRQQQVAVFLPYKIHVEYRRKRPRKSLGVFGVESARDCFGACQLPDNRDLARIATVYGCNRFTHGRTYERSHRYCGRLAGLGRHGRSQRTGRRYEQLLAGHELAHVASRPETYQPRYVNRAAYQDDMYTSRRYPDVEERAACDGEAGASTDLKGPRGVMSNVEPALAPQQSQTSNIWRKGNLERRSRL